MVEVYPGLVVNVNTPIRGLGITNAGISLYFIFKPSDVEILVDCGTEDLVLNYASLSGEKLKFDKKDTAECVIEALKTMEGIKLSKDEVYYGVYEDVALVYFYNHDLMFAIGDDDVYFLGGILDAPTSPDARGFEEGVRQFIRDIEKMAEKR